MTFKQFQEEMSPAHCNSFGDMIARIGRIIVKYDPDTNEFIIYKYGDLILDGADLRTAKAFIKLEEENE